MCSTGQFYGDYQKKFINDQVVENLFPIVKNSNFKGYSRELREAARKRGTIAVHTLYTMQTSCYFYKNNFFFPECCEGQEEILVHRIPAADSVGP